MTVGLGVYVKQGAVTVTTRVLVRVTVRVTVPLGGHQLVVEVPIVLLLGGLLLLGGRALE